MDNTKSCLYCKEEKELSLFVKSKTARLGVSNCCLQCRRKKSAEWRQKNPEQNSAIKKAWYEKNKEHVLRKTKEYREARPEWYAETTKQYLEKNKERNREKANAYYAANKKLVAEKLAKKKAESPAFALNNSIRWYVWKSLKGIKNGKKTEQLVGWSEQELGRHIERQFLPGMGWHNRSEWHIDHIVPLSSFNITGPDCPEFKRAWALANLRPIWATDNLKKRHKRTHLI